MGHKENVSISSGASIFPGASSRPRTNGGSSGPATRIKKNPKLLSERRKNCDAQNTLIEESIRKECLRSEGFDPFSPPTPGETIEFYSDRHAVWTKVGKARDGWTQSAKASLIVASSPSDKKIDALYWVRLEFDKTQPSISWAVR